MDQEQESQWYVLTVHFFLVATTSLNSVQVTLNRARTNRLKNYSIKALTIHQVLKMKDIVSFAGCLSSPKGRAWVVKERGGGLEVWAGIWHDNLASKG